MNTFGNFFRCTTFGESHGKALGVVIDGCPPGIAFSADDVQPYLDRRRPGTSDLTTPRRETDRVDILSGVFEGRTTGTPIAMIVGNIDARSGDYAELRDRFRPGHADLVYEQKYGIRDFRGGGRSSGRETVARVMAGALAARILAADGMAVSSRILSIHGNTDPGRFEDEIRAAKEADNSVGGVVEITATGCPPGLGDPVFGKLDAALASAMMSIGSVKAVEIGDGFAVTDRFGSENNDEIGPDGYLTNHAGGILGGISTGEAIVIRIAVKPTPSICLQQRTLDSAGRPAVLSVDGRHDPCIVPRILVVAECMAAIVLADASLAQSVNRWFAGKGTNAEKEKFR
ncbi:chorismate synthase [Methanomicrobiaceae archaeon CYW5]|uniref:chorismate synthase n=1 Tax=Methanovulcanius yangii TaxID=1789227 RepID=UPI0029CAA376|nr:chorismate synthase [Methanovulcanius yangii]MBT8508060.1 chorismate synthase [Methanovulcanius yangii]